AIVHRPSKIYALRSGTGETNHRRSLRWTVRPLGLVRLEMVIVSRSMLIGQRAEVRNPAARFQTKVVNSDGCWFEEVLARKPIDLPREPCTSAVVSAAGIDQNSHNYARARRSRESQRGRFHLATDPYRRRPLPGSREREIRAR